MFLVKILIGLSAIFLFLSHFLVALNYFLAQKVQFILGASFGDILLFFNGLILLDLACYHFLVDDLHVNLQKWTIFFLISMGIFYITLSYLSVLVLENGILLKCFLVRWNEIDEVKKVSNGNIQIIFKNRKLKNLFTENWSLSLYKPFEEKLEWLKKRVN